MGETTLEKKKQIENYIVASYFDRCKNVESYIGGCDIVYGSKNDDIPDILVEVEDFSNSGFMVVRWNIINDQVSEWQNEFMICIDRELSITRNRCDSVDAMSYAFVSWKNHLEEKTIFLKDKRIEELESEVKALRDEKEVMQRHIQELEIENASLGEANKYLKSSKDYIELSMRSMMITHKPHNGDAEIGVTGTIPERDFLNATNPFDIPCDVVMVSKRIFERLRVENDRLRTVNEQLKKKLEEFDPMPESKELLKRLYSIDDVEKLEWVLKHTCGGMCSVNGWRAISLFWKKNYETLSKLVGFSSVEEIQDYLTNEAKRETLHEAIVKLIDANKRVCEEWCSANSENNSWKATAECNSPKELMTKLNLLRDTIEHEHDRTTDNENLCEDYRNQIKAWKEATECSTPEEANKKLASYEGRLDSVKQSASIAIRHLDNIVFRDDKRTDWSDK